MPHSSSFDREYKRLKAAEHQLHLKAAEPSSPRQEGHGTALEEKIAEARRRAALDTPLADTSGGSQLDKGT